MACWCCSLLLVSFLGGLLITVLSFILILTVYGRFFKLYIYTAISPLPFASFAGENTAGIGKAFVKSYIVYLIIDHFTFISVCTPDVLTVS